MLIYFEWLVPSSRRYVHDSFRAQHFCNGINVSNNNEKMSCNLKTNTSKGCAVEKWIFASFDTSFVITLLKWGFMRMAQSKANSPDRTSWLILSVILIYRLSIYVALAILCASRLIWSNCVQINCYLLSSASLNIRMILRCKLWRQSFFECIWKRFGAAKMSFTSCRSLFDSPMSILHLNWPNKSKQKKNLFLYVSNFLEFFFLETCLNASTDVFPVNSPKILVYSIESTNLSLNVLLMGTRSNNSLAIARENETKMTEIASISFERLVEIHVRHLCFFFFCALCLIVNLCLCAARIQQLLTTMFLCFDARKRWNNLVLTLERTTEKKNNNVLQLTPV